MTAAKLSDPPYLTDDERSDIIKNDAMQSFLVTSHSTKILAGHIAQTTIFKVAELINKCNSIEELNDVVGKMKMQIPQKG